ncbi:MAG: type VI secretion system-associated protein TagO [Rhizobiaceae bacterium]
MQKITFALVAILAAVSSARGETDDPRACAAITDSLQRLNCYDRIFPVGEATEYSSADDDPMSSENAEPVSSWVVREGKSAIDDSPEVQAYLLPVAVSSTGIGEGELILMLRCYENTTSAVLSSNSYITGDSAQVTIRIGDDQAKTFRWRVSSNRRGVGLWSGSQSIPFIRSLRNNERLVVRLESRHRVDAQFELGNVSELAQKLANACNWKL